MLNNQEYGLFQILLMNLDDILFLYAEVNLELEVFQD